MTNFSQWEKTRDEELNKTMLITKAGCWLECSDYEGTVNDIKSFLHQDRLELLKYIRESLPKGSVEEDIKCDGECTPACGWDECLHEVESLLDDMLNQCSKK